MQKKLSCKDNLLERRGETETEREREREDQEQVQAMFVDFKPSLFLEGWLLLLKASIPPTVTSKTAASMIIAFFIPGSGYI